MFLSFRHGSSILLIMLMASAAALHKPDGLKHQKDRLINAGISSKSSNRAVIETKVLVLGAGVAGIAAAKILSEQGVDFIILEGKNRIGGRMFDGKLGNYTIEYGANWLHDIDKNVLWPYAQKYGLNGTIDTLDDAIVRSAGGADVTIQAEILIRKYEIAIRKLVGVYFRHCIPTCDLSMRQALNLAGWSEPATRLEQAVEFYMFDWTECLSSEEISFYAFIQPYLIPDDGTENRDYLVTDPRGFAYLLRSIASEFLSANDIRLRLNEAVTSIDYRRTDSAKVLVHTASGNVYAAEHVIITFSNNVITHGDVQFQPALPDWKVTALRHMPTSVYTKHFIDLSEPIIDENAYILLVHDGEGKEWRKNAAWQNLAIQPLLRDTNVALVTNVAAEGLNSSQLTSAEAIDFIVASGAKVYPRLGKLDKSRMAETHYNWANDRFARGGYATPIVGMDARMREDLKASVNGVLHFAGDGTDLEDYGTLTSAFSSGQLIALQILIELTK